jgi:riboflavin synthase alpha subunit
VTDWTGLTIHESVRALRDGRVTARVLVDAYLGRIARLDDTLGAFLTVAACGGTRCEIAYVPHTLRVTVAADYVLGRRVNLEVDLVARYIERMLGQSK